MTWRPTATRATLVARAELLARIRAWFAGAGVLEVDTPLLGNSGASDPALESLSLERPTGRYFLQTSPESAMKRLLAAGIGDLYQICKAFRGEERSRLHRGEFTMIEWYRLGIDHHRLMEDVAAIATLALPGRRFERLSLAQLAAEQAAPDPHCASTAELATWALAKGAVLSPADRNDRVLLLDFLLESLVRLGLGQGRAAFLYDFPVEQAAYAQVRAGSPAVAERFELIVDGIELANGYHEVTAATEQSARYAREQEQRALRGLPAVRPDERLLAALVHGLPPCAGVALGFDRLLMLSLGASEIGEVLGFGDDLI